MTDENSEECSRDLEGRQRKVREGKRETERERYRQGKAKIET